jgi:Tol biopolymer transport system component
MGYKTWIAATTRNEKGEAMQRNLFVWSTLAMSLAALARVTSAATPEEESLLAELRACPYRIVHESYRDNHWNLVVRNADGSNPVTLTRSGRNENYPHVSPDGRKITFEFEEGTGKAKRRNIYMMNIDGSGRTRVAEAGRDPCWTWDGKSIVYLKDEVDETHYKDFATKGLYFYSLATAKTEQHVNHELYHLYNVCCTPDGNWFVSTVHAGMGCSHGILAFETHGQRVYNLGIPGCRPDISPDGKKIAWGADDCVLRVADFNVVDGIPKVTNARDVATSKNPIHIYHIDWSPDSRYVAFSRGPTKESTLGMAPEVVGIKADGWDICVADAAKTNRCVAITTDGKSNKEPDWFTAAK